MQQNRFPEALVTGITTTASIATAYPLAIGELAYNTDTGSLYVASSTASGGFGSLDGRYINTSGDSMTGALGVITGSLSAPGLFISGDPNTGIHSTAADQISLVAGGVDRFNTGQFGRFQAITDQFNFNTVSPSSLTINNNGNFYLGASAGSDTYFYGQGTVNAPWMRVLGTGIRFAGINDSTANAAFNITSAQDQVNFRLKLISGQTENMQEFRDASNNLMSSMNRYADWTHTSFHIPNGSNRVLFNNVFETEAGYTSTGETHVTSASNMTNYAGGNLAAMVGSNNIITNVGGSIDFAGVVTGTVRGLVGTISEAAGIKAIISYEGSYIVNATGIEVQFVNTGGASYQAKGIHVNNMTASTPGAGAWAIQTEGGMVEHSSGHASVVPMNIRGYTAQTADLEQIRDVNDVVLAKTNNLGQRFGTDHDGVVRQLMSLVSIIINNDEVICNNGEVVYL